MFTAQGLAPPAGRPVEPFLFDPAEPFVEGCARRLHVVKGARPFRTKMA